MREIKFRTWDNYTGFKFITEPNDFKYWQSGYGDNPISKWPKNINQFTGLHDKNGKEIYEGDIVSVIFAGRKINMKIDWYDRHHCFALFEGQYPYRSINSGRSYLIDHTYEVIGNIYETPQLLEK